MGAPLIVELWRKKHHAVDIPIAGIAAGGKMDFNNSRREAVASHRTISRTGAKIPTAEQLP
jgi:hypothetical protein